MLMDSKLEIVTPLYAAVFALIFVLLSVRTLLLRRRLGVGIGDADKPVLARAVRAHANFAEYVPIALIVIVFFEATIGSAIGAHILCGLLLVGRLSHAYGICQTTENYAFRVLGMALTFTAIVSASARIIAAYLF